MGQRGLLLGGGSPLDGLPRRPPARAVLDTGARVEDRDLAPADAEAHVDVRRHGEPYLQCRVDGGADGGVAALELVTDGESRRIGRRQRLVVQRRCEPAVQSGAVRGVARSHDVTDQRCSK